MLFSVQILENFIAEVWIIISLLVFTALQDIFLAFNMFSILVKEKRPDIVRDEGR